MKIKIDTKAMATVLSAVANHTKAVHANLVTVKGKSFVVAQGSGAFLRLGLGESIVEEDGAGFTFNVNVMTNIIKGRTEVLLEYADDDSSEAKFSAKGKGRKYTGTMVILPKEEIKTPKIEETTTLELTSNIHKSLSDALQAVSLTDIYTGSVMHMVTRISSKGLLAACYDRFHLGIYEDKNITVETTMEFSLPLDSFTAVQSLTDGREYKLRITESALIAQGTDFFILLPLMQSDETKDLATALKFRTTATESDPDGSFIMEAGSLTTTLSNMYGVYEESSKVELTAKAESVTFEMATTYGKVRESFKIKDVKWKEGVKFSFDPNLLNDIMGRMGQNDPIELNLVEDKFAYIGRGTGKGVETFYFCSLL